MADNKNDTIYERILQFEERKQENLDMIYLFKDSNNSQWYKAYEWSAYLLEFITNNLEENNRLKPIKKQLINSNKTIINVGIPITSLEKFCDPSLIIDKQIDASQHIAIKIKLSNITFENYKQKLNDWKILIPIKTYQNSNQNKSTNIYSHPITFLSIMKEIMKFNPYNRSEDEMLQFISDLKCKCADLIC